MRTIRILLVDDHAVLREGLRLLLNGQPDMEVVSQAGDGRAALQQAQQDCPDVVVLDVSMPEMNGVQATKQLTQLCPEARIVALTRHSESGYVHQLLQAGARGYVLKQAIGDELLIAIRAVAMGDTYLDSSLAKYVGQRLVAAPTPNSVAPMPELSRHEAEVARLTAHGYSNKEIATQLDLSVKTVDTFKGQAMEKLGLHSRAALVRYALQCGWLDQT